MDKGIESRVKFAIDGGEQKVLKPDGNRPPIASDLAPGKHHVRIELSDAKLPAGSTDKIKIWGIGGAGSL